MQKINNETLKPQLVRDLDLQAAVGRSKINSVLNSFVYY